MKFFIYSTVALAVLLSTKAIGNSDKFRIVATVNNKAITDYDLNNRINFVLFTSNIQPTEKARVEIKNQILQNLIEEEIKLQEAKRQNINVDDAEIEQIKSEIEEQNSLPKGKLAEAFIQQGINLETLLRQIRAGVIWRQLLSTQCLTRINVCKEEVDEEFKNITKNAHKVQNIVSEIQLTPKNGQSSAEIKQLAQDLIKQMQQIPDMDARHMTFYKLAQQFSTSVTANVGGALGIIQEGTLKAPFEEALKKMKPGELSPIIESDGSYSILLLNDRRTPDQNKSSTTPSVDLRQVFLPLKSDATPTEVSAVEKRLLSIKDSLRSEEDFSTINQRMGGNAPDIIGVVAVNTLTEPIKSCIEKTPIKGITPPTRTEDGMAIFMVCNKGTVETNLPTRETIEQQLRVKKLETVAKQYLGNLRQAATIHVKA